MVQTNATDEKKDNIGFFEEDIFFNVVNGEVLDATTLKWPRSILSLNRHLKKTFHS